VLDIPQKILELKEVVKYKLEVCLYFLSFGINYAIKTILRLIVIGRVRALFAVECAV
jgi:hypothetical protein